MAIAMQNLILAATEEGLGTRWTSSFNEKKAKKALGIPKDVRVVTMTPLGYPAEEKGPISLRKPLNEIVSYNHWTPAHLLIFPKPSFPEMFICNMLSMWLNGLVVCLANGQ